MKFFNPSVTDAASSGPMFRWQLAAVVLVSSMVGAVALAHEGEHEPGAFASEVVAEGFTDPLDIAMAPDGSLYVAELRGQVRRVVDGVIQPQPVIELDVNAVVERGLLGMELDPGFSQNGYMYLFYTPEIAGLDVESSRVNRLVRVTIENGLAVPGSEFVLLGSEGGTPQASTCDVFLISADCLPQNGLSHGGGGMFFLSDGSLIVTTGDGVWSGTSVTDSIKAQDPESLAGKVLRINPANGEGYADNPYFTGDLTANRAKVWATGLRNPYKVTAHPTFNVPLVGDVGWDSTEEINVVPAGANLGWPCLEGSEAPGFYASEAVCQDLYDSPPVNLQPPYYFFPRGTGAAVIGGVFINSNAYPSQYLGHYLFGEYVSGEIRALPFSLTAPPDPADVEVLATAEAPVAFVNGTDGYVYYTAFSAGEVRRLVDISINVPPVARASATPNSGDAPLIVSFSSDATSDSNGDPVTLSWDFGDGTTSSEANPVHVYAEDGEYVAELTAIDDSGAQDTVAVRVVVGKHPPTPRITQPFDGLTYEAGENIIFKGEATDIEDGVIDPANLSWTIRISHCVEGAGEVDCHVHPFVEETGSTVSVGAPEHGEGEGDFYFLDVALEAIDSDQLTGEHRITVGPDTDGDGCMDFYLPHTVQTGPFVNIDDGSQTVNGEAEAIVDHISVPEGGAQLLAGAVAAAGFNSAAAAASASLDGTLMIADAGKYSFIFDGDVTGTAISLPQPEYSKFGVHITGFLFDDNSGDELLSQRLTEREAQFALGGPPVEVSIQEIAPRWLFASELEPGRYRWRFDGAATAEIASNNDNFTGVAAGFEMILRSTTVCRQRAPDAALP